MGRRHHHKGCGSCGGRGCGGCGGGGELPPWLAMQMLAAQAAQGLPPMTDVMTANGLVQVPTTSAMGYPRFGQAAPVSAYVGPAQILGQYAAMSAAAGFPITPRVMSYGFKAKKVRKHKTRELVLHPEAIITGNAVSLFISCRTAKHFDICSLRIGGHYLIDTGSRHGDGVSAERYSVPGGVAIPLPGGLLLPGQRVCLTVKNHDSHSHWFRASFEGVTI